MVGHKTHGGRRSGDAEDDITKKKIYGEKVLFEQVSFHVTTVEENNKRAHDDTTEVRQRRTRQCP